jgi:phosphate-selective porin OprO and OprP
LVLRFTLLTLLTCAAAHAQEPVNPIPGGLLWSDGGGNEVQVHGRTYIDFLRGGEDAGDLRQMRVQFSGTFQADWKARAQLELTNPDRPLVELYVEKALTERLAARAGQFREPFGVEANTSISALPFPEHSTPTEAFAPGRNRGVVLRSIGEWNWSAGAFQRSDGTLGPTSPENALSARSWKSWKPTRLSRVHLGLSVSMRDSGSGALRFRAHPGTKLLPRQIDTGDLFGADATTFAFEAAWQSTSRTLQAEWLGAQVDLAGGGEAGLSGLAVSGAWFLTGEMRDYNTGKGAWSRVTPNGEGPALELAARASWTDLTDGAVTGGEQVDLGVGLNVHLTRRSRVMIHLIHSDAKGALKFDGLLLRFHAGF